MAFTISGECDGCTACVRRCPNGAISGARGDRHVILAPACVDCGACGVICPRCAIRDQAGNVVLLRKSAERPVAVVDERSCTGCQRCVWTCSRAAMVLRPWSPADHFQVARVAVRRCVGCGLCALDCPHEAIELGARQAALGRRAADRALRPAVCLAGKCV